MMLPKEMVPLQDFREMYTAHTGVITTESSNGNDWKHVIGNWGTADARVLMTREDVNLYSISYNITDFYNIPAAEEVLQMAVRFSATSMEVLWAATQMVRIFLQMFILPI
jgi:hypothetical protein